MKSSSSSRAPGGAGLEADTEVTKEIVDYVGHWEEISSTVTQSGY